MSLTSHTDNFYSKDPMAGDMEPGRANIYKFIPKS